MPASIQDPRCWGGPALAGGPARDTNETAVVTGWATAAGGQGRARVRAILAVDNPWKHVCSNSSQDNPPGYCNEPANRNGNPSITPADPNDPNGPAAYDDLPRPQLGCSEIDPSVHGAGATMALGIANCLAWEYSPCWPVTCSAQGPSFKNYPYPNPGSGGSAPPRLVVTGDRSKATCDSPNGIQYQGYFDCALSTPCPAAICGSSGPVLTRKGCLKSGTSPLDSRLLDTNRYQAAPCVTHTGMVFTSSLNWPANYGSTNNGILAYVMRPGDFTIQGRDLHGAVVIEGNGNAGCSGGNRDLQHRNGARIWTATNVYGYPLAYLVFDPVAAVNNAPQPTANPLNQQNTCADMGSASGTEIHGIVYSGGNVEFNPIIVDGGVVGFQIQTQGSSSSYSYNPTYGNATPPPGFPEGSGNTVVLVRKSFIVCVNYAADTGGGSPCQ